jgi:hypothetical protein
MKRFTNNLRFCCCFAVPAIEDFFIVVFVYDLGFFLFLAESAPGWIFLTQPQECWDCRHAPPHPAQESKTSAIKKSELNTIVIHLQKTETRFMPVTRTNINSRWIKDLNIRHETLQLVQERARNTLEGIGIGKDFLSRTQAAQQLRERMDKWDYIKLKSFCTTKEMVSKLKRSPTEWEKIFASYTSDKGLVTRIYRKLKS